MKTFLKAILIIMALSSYTACHKPAQTDTKPASEAPKAAQGDTEQPKAEAPKAEATPPESPKAEVQNPDIDSPQAVAQPNAQNMLKTEKFRNFILVTKADNPVKLPNITPSLAADQIERVLITSYEGKRENKPWYIRVEGLIELEGQLAYDIQAGQGDDENSFEPTIHGAILASGEIYLYDFDHWMHYAHIVEDAEEPEKD